MSNNTTISITSIDWSDHDNCTDIVDIIHLSNGQIIESWNGQASYDVHDRAHGKVEVGAVLISTEEDESYDGRPYTIFNFAQA